MERRILTCALNRPLDRKTPDPDLVPVTIEMIMESSRKHWDHLKALSKLPKLTDNPGGDLLKRSSIEILDRAKLRRDEINRLRSKDLALV